MSEGPPVKQARANLADDVHFQRESSEEDVSEMLHHIHGNIQELIHDQLVDIVAKAAAAHDDVNAMVGNAMQEAHRTAEEMRWRAQSRVFSFAFYSRSIWKEINVTYRGMTYSQQHDVAYMVYRETVDTIQSIVDKCGPLANPKTRFNGLSALRYIGKTICLADNPLAEEVQNCFNEASELEDAMQEIVDAMSPEEREVVRANKSSDDALWPKLLQLYDLGLCYGVFRNLDKALDSLDGSGGWRRLWAVRRVGS